MSSNNTQTARPSQAIKDTTKRRAALKDNSWIKRGTEEDEPVDVDPNYGKGVLLKTQDNNESKPAETSKTNPATMNSVTKSSVTSPSTPTTTNPYKPPVPAKNPAHTTAAKSFTARVFSGANSSEKPLTSVKKSVDEKPLVLKEPPKEVATGENSAPLSPVKSTIVATATVIKNDSNSSTPQSTTITSTSKTLDIPADIVSPRLSPTVHTNPVSNYNTAPKSTTAAAVTVTTATNVSKGDVKSPSETLDILADLVSPRLSPTVHTNYVSSKNSSDTWRYSSSQSADTIGTKLVSTLSSPPVSSPPLTQLTTTRIIGKRDLCSYCGKNITEGERMILDDLKIFSHTSCFKCELCYRSLGSLEAGATLWVHREKVNCENCYRKTKDQWFH